MGSLDIESIHQTSIQLFENHVKEKENIQQQFEDTEWVRLIDNAFWIFFSAIINPVSIYAIGVFLVSLLWTLNIFHTLLKCFYVNFEKVNAGWEVS